MAKVKSTTSRSNRKKGAGADKPGTPLLGWTIGDEPTPNPWPRNLKRSLRMKLLARAVPRVLRAADSLAEVTQGLCFLDLEHTDQQAVSVVRKVLLRELWRIVSADEFSLERSAAYMAELAAVQGVDHEA